MTFDTLVHSMLDVTPDDIAQLNDTDLRELVGRLCEAELASQGFSPAAVTWGGNQTAADGGIDVRVALTPDSDIDGFIPRSATGFQVKKSDIPKAAILTEMCPKNAIRPSIQDLAHVGGAYIIVSSGGSTTDSVLRNRQDAMREALKDLLNADQLHTDFYDRTRVATWVRRHPSLIIWVRAKVGRALVGWQPYGPWSGSTEDVEAEYLVDDRLRLHFGSRNEPAQPVTEAIDDLRDTLNQPSAVVRLVGLSGVGKTRLVQALFDARVGSRPIKPSLAIYANLSDNPEPQPVGLASDLIANRMRSILIVDNCPPSLHRRLTDLCAASGSTVSILTVEYDVRDDQPEGTQVVTLDTSSPELIKKLVVRRYPHLSEVDARAIADASGGNARVAIALAETVEHSETIAGISDDELFQRLFRQRHEANDALLRAAKACSLVYSFLGEALTGDNAELPRLALLAEQTPPELHRNISELLRRDLVQQRSVWRAVLPHGISNRLAAQALEDIPYDLIDQQLVTGGTERLAQSFSRRLSFLHEHPIAMAIARRWLSPDGLLGDVSSLNDLDQEMFENIAPVSPDATLAALERVGNGDSAVAAQTWQRNRSLLRSLAYDPRLFDRSAALLAYAATKGENERDTDTRGTSETFSSLFTIHLSGTHATIEQRLGIIEHLLRSNEPRKHSLGLTALDNMLEATHFSSAHRFEFGARSRDYGYNPKNYDEVAQWYGAALALIKRMAIIENVMKSELRSLLARNFRTLCTSAHMFDQLDDLFRSFAAEGFWREGWQACRKTIHFDKNGVTPEIASRLSDLEIDLRPSSLSEQVQAVVLGNGFDLEDIYLNDDVEANLIHLDTTARKLGEAVALDEAVFSEILPHILREGRRVRTFGRGLASASKDHYSRWSRIVEGLKDSPPEQRSAQLLQGYLAELWEQDRDLAQDLLDSALDEPILAELIPALHSGLELDARSVNRLKQALISGRVPVLTYQNLALGQTTVKLESEDLRGLLLLISEQPDGFHVAADILFFRLYLDRSAGREHNPGILDVGRELLKQCKFSKSRRRESYNLAEIVRSCLTRPKDGQIASEVTKELMRSVAANEAYASDNADLLSSLLSVQPLAVLDTLFEERESDQQPGIGVFDHLYDHRPHPADAIPCENLIAWCEEDAEARYPFAASFVSFKINAEESNDLTWSAHATALISHAPNPSDVLTAFVHRFLPMSWSGSRATLLEENARLLDSLEPLCPSIEVSYLREIKDNLAREIETQRQFESRRDKERDERFE
jgi:hypothetical protein